MYLAFLRVFALGQLIRFNLTGLAGPDKLPGRTVSNNLGSKLLAIQQILPCVRQQTSLINYKLLSLLAKMCLWLQRGFLFHHTCNLSY